MKNLNDCQVGDTYRNYQIIARYAPKAKNRDAKGTRFYLPDGTTLVGRKTGSSSPSTVKAVRTPEAVTVKD